jgi:hypothetical protein
LISVRVRIELVTAHKRGQNGARWLSDFASLSWPDTNTLTIKSVAAGVQGQVRRVELRGTGQTLHHPRNDQD